MFQSFYSSLSTWIGCAASPWLLYVFVQTIVENYDPKRRSNTHPNALFASGALLLSLAAAVVTFVLLAPLLGLWALLAAACVQLLMAALSLRAIYKTTFSLSLGVAVLATLLVLAAELGLGMIGLVVSVVHPLASIPVFAAILATPYVSIWRRQVLLRRLSSIR